MAKPRPMTEEEIAEARQMKKMGYGLREIAAALGFHVTTISRNVRPDGKRQHRNRQRDYYQRNHAKGCGHNAVSHAETRVQAERLMEMIPDDTRDLTARLMGDPLPGRSALHRSKQNGVC